MTQSKTYNEIVTSHFSRLIAAHGDSLSSVDWGSASSQELRFDVLYDIGINRSSTVLDVGCGRGDFFDYLNTKGGIERYQGIDITPGMIELAKQRFPETSFAVCDLLHDPYPEGSYEFVVASGIFYLKIDDNENFLRHMVTSLFAVCSHGLAFNCLSEYTKEKEEGEFYFNPCNVFSVCQQLTPFVTLRHDYKKNDFTIHMFKHD
jgi:SAM-dependent methyltransferase